MKNKVENVNWHVNWALITNKYGKLLSYNLPAYNRTYASCKYQPYIIQMLETKKYDMFLDVGAYIGLFSQVASHNCRFVYAYEAHPFFYGVLLYNMKFYKNVICKYGYISNKGDTPKIDKDNFMQMVVIDNDTIPYSVDVLTLDEEWDIHNSTKVLVKLDVEGNELNVLKGAKKMLKNSNVHWIIDVHPPRGVEVDDVKEFFKNRQITLIGKKVLKIE